MTASVRNRVTSVTSAAGGGGLGVLAELAALLELVVVPAAERVAHGRAAQQPGDPGAGVRPGQRGQPDEDSLGGGALAGDGDVLAGVPRGDGRVAEVGDAVGDAFGVLALAQGGVAVGAQRVGPGPRAGGVHHGAGEQALAAGGALDVHGERVVLASGVDHAGRGRRGPRRPRGRRTGPTPGGGVQERRRAAAGRPSRHSPPVG